MNKKLLIFSIIISTNLLAIQKIDFNTVVKKEAQTKNTPEEKKSKNPIPEKRKKVKLKKYTNIKYYKEFEEFSVIKRSKLSFKKLLLQYGLSKDDFKNIFGYDTGSLSILLSALAYDWLLKKPELAENFYNILINKYHKNLPIRFQDYIADYYLRTGRIKDVDDIIENKKCLPSLKYINECFYYKGLSVWANTGKIHNSYLDSALNEYPIIQKKLSKY